MIALFNNVTGTMGRSRLLAWGFAVALGIAPVVAGAQERSYGDREGRDYRHTVERRYERDDRRDYDRRGRSDVRVDVGIHNGRTHVRRETEYRPRYQERRVRYWVEPEFKVVKERVWVEPVYETVTQRVWIAPVYKTVYEEVYVPARYEVRECVRYEGWRKIITRERVLIEPAHTKRIPRQVCVSEGRWEIVTKQVCVREGRWNVVERQVCVSEGRWDYRVERVEYTGRDHETLLDARF